MGLIDLVDTFRKVIRCPEWQQPHVGGHAGNSGRCCMKTLWGGRTSVTLRRSHTTGVKSKVIPRIRRSTALRTGRPTIRPRSPRRCDGVGVLGGDRCLDAPPERQARRAAALLGSRHRDRPDPATPLPLPLRQAEGFLHALFGMLRLDLSAPDDTTLSRRSQPLRRRSEMHRFEPSARYAQSLSRALP